MQEGSPYEIYHNPRNLFVAEFIGDPRINLFRGTINQTQLECADLALPLTKGLGVQGTKLVASIRPEAIKVSYKPKKGWLQVRVENVQPTGADTILQTMAGDTPITLLQSGFITLDVDAPLWISFDIKTINFFDPETEQNLAAT